MFLLATSSIVISVKLSERCTHAGTREEEEKEDDDEEEEEKRKRRQVIEL